MYLYGNLNVKCYFTTKIFKQPKTCYYSKKKKKKCTEYSLNFYNYLFIYITFYDTNIALTIMFRANNLCHISHCEM